jgi:aspartate/glutamate racemase
MGYFKGIESAPYDKTDFIIDNDILDVSVKIFDTTIIHAKKAVEFALK